MSGRSQIFTTWKLNDQLNNGANIIIPPVSVMSQFMPYMTFSVRADQILTLTIETSTDGGITWRVPHTLIMAVATNVYTPYELPAPRGQNGWVVISAPQVRIRLANAAGFDSLFEFYASLTNFGG